MCASCGCKCKSGKPVKGCKCNCSTCKPKVKKASK